MDISDRTLQGDRKSHGDVKNKVRDYGISPVHTLGTVLCLSMVVCPISKWIDLKIYTGWWPVLDNVRWEIILKGEFMRGTKCNTFLMGLRKRLML